MNQWRKGIASWRCGKTLYLSIPFTWLLTEAETLAKAHNGPVIAGGPAVDLMGAPWATSTPPTCPFDTLAMHNPCATFTTRGCPNNCAFCAVPKIEGHFRELQDWKPAPLVCDNNFLAASMKHITSAIDRLKDFPLVDFNQGLQAARLDTPRLTQISRLHKVKIRFALDHTNQEPTVRDAVITCQALGIKNIGIYVLIGFNDTPEDALHRLETVRSWGIRPNPMRYQPLDATIKNAYIAPGWDDTTLKRMMRYFSRLRFLEHIPFADYNPPQSDLWDV